MHNALENPHLYVVMFGATSLKGFTLAAERHGDRPAQLRDPDQFVARAMDGGQLRRTDPARVAAQVWTAMHGYVMLELAGLHLPPDNPVEDVMRPLLTNLAVGLSPGASGASAVRLG